MVPVKFQEALSIILFPSTMAMIASIIFSLAFSSELGELSVAASIGIGILFLAVVPSLPVLLYFKKHSDACNKLEKGERRKFYLAALVGYLSGATVFYHAHAHPMFCLSVAYLCVAGVFAVLNQFIKISAHAGGITGPVTALVYVFGAHLLPLYLLTLIVVWNRLKLGAHTLRETVAGAVLPIFITFGVYLILW